MWNLKSQTNKHNKTKLMDTENTVLVASREMAWVGEMGEGGQEVQTSTCEMNKS